MVGNSITITITFIIYLAGMMAIGVWAYRRTNNLEDYILGGRSLGAWPSALSAGASDMSGWLLLGLPGAAFASGLGAGWIGVGLLAGTYLNWLIVAPRLRTMSYNAGNALTLPQYFANRFEDHPSLRIISAIFILLFFLFYTSSGLVAGGKLFETVFGLDYTLAVAIGTLAIVSYTLFGGFLAVSWTDLVQGLLMVAALLIVPVLAMNAMDVSPMSAISAQNPAMTDIWTDGTGTALGFIGIVSSLAWGLGYFGQPHILARFKGIKSREAVKSARRIAVTWTALGLFGAMFVGVVGVGYFSDGLADGETVFIMLVEAVFHPVIAGFLLAAILAAIMSTADSQLLVSSSALTEDFYRAIFNPNADSESLVRIGRIAVVVIALIAFAISLDDESVVLELVAYAWAGFGAAFGPAIILSLFWERMNRQGCLAGIIVGGSTVVIWDLIGGPFGLYEIVPGFILATIAIIVVTLMTPPPSKKMEEVFNDSI
ncbi:sodium/proline symporter PutP [Natronospirillum operosum]|uniref:Sodium/proline symporter n=1 Tax=Natronospirillum operosum TaxID=2759953 RepID=A0A4Z0WCD1_9GAMM|nr:sodium/proline symporter PutP [Natronospirillum operosum]TGG91325.1 sodium/proline symporter PutP [Natronospirillum operosum]